MLDVKIQPTTFICSVSATFGATVSLLATLFDIHRHLTATELSVSKFARGQISVLRGEGMNLLEIVEIRQIRLTYTAD